MLPVIVTAQSSGRGFACLSTLAYLAATDINADNINQPLIRSTVRMAKQLTGNSLTTKDVCDLVKRRLNDAELSRRLSPQSFWLSTVNDLLTHGAPLNDLH